MHPLEKQDYSYWVLPLALLTTQWLLAAVVRSNEVMKWEASSTSKQYAEFNLLLKGKKHLLPEGSLLLLLSHKVWSRKSWVNNATILAIYDMIKIDFFLTLKHQDGQSRTKEAKKSTIT